MRNRVDELQSRTQTAWEQGVFIRTDISPELPDYRQTVTSQPYEGFMTAWVIDGTPGEVGRLVVEFPAAAVEDNFLHTHPHSARCLQVLNGSGWFIARRNGRIGAAAIKPGDEILMPKGVQHTFLAGSDGMTILSYHGPYQDLHDPAVIIRSDEQVDLTGIMVGRVQLPSLFDI
jgi:quercetin dioxygenase-like cupin family protein